jgi:hypothetical protein
MEARQGGDVFGSVDDSPVAKGDAPSHKIINPVMQKRLIR